MRGGNDVVSTQPAKFAAVPCMRGGNEVLSASARCHPSHEEGHVMGPAGLEPCRKRTLVGLHWRTRKIF